jgi:hypothetical protein
MVYLLKIPTPVAIPAVIQRFGFFEMAKKASCIAMIHAIVTPQSGVSKNAPASPPIEDVISATAVKDRSGLIFRARRQMK